jgi:uncharacterized protein (TIGR02453 family)
MSDTTGAFAGFRPAALAFFAGLREHNDPVWFKPRKPVYDSEVLAPFRALVVTLAAALDAAGLPLSGDPARAIFRIYRDVRFSADKRLYKTHAGAVLTRSGGKRDPGLLYIHLEPGESMAAAGFWHPEPDLLARLRYAILDDPDGFLAMAGRLDALGYRLSSDNALSRPPRGFEAAKGTPVEAYVCWKSFTAHAALSDAEMTGPGLVGRIVEFALAMRPLLDWGWTAADEERPPPLHLRMPTRKLPKPDF